MRYKYDNVVNCFKKKLGIDRSIVANIALRVWQGLAGLVTIGTIGFFLTPEEQGFYYTFFSILSLQVFVELGLSMVLVQFASHEKAYLEWTEGGILEGNEKAKQRLTSLISLALKWYAVVFLLIIICLLPSGYLFFSPTQVKYPYIQWQIPWILLVVFTAALINITPLFSIIEGCGKVKEVALIKIKQEIVGNILFWAILSSGGGLIAVSFLFIGRLTVAVCWLITGWRKNFLINIAKTKIKTTNKINWFHEIFQFQWKIALSWISGYFIFQLFNPVLFKYHGAKVAGQMGMTLAAFNGIIAISMTWINTKVPTFGILIAKQEYKKLDRMFFSSLYQSGIVVSLLSVFFVAIVSYMQSMKYPLGERFLPFLPIIFLVGVTIINHIVFANAAYLRAHKKEPLLLSSIVGAVLLSSSTIIFGKIYGVLGITTGYFFIAVFTGLIWVTKIFIDKRRIWHVMNE
jgi:O-antigen/teichoic acid export membrane protein